jgi:tRNA threonylcarbamoyladenosine biosynthesis protein TsaB
MQILSFDTCGEFCSVALHAEGKLIAFTQDVSRSLQAAEILIPMIEVVMSKSGLFYDDLDYVALTRGPGSFTGIRVGLAAAEGILIATKASPLVLSNFDLWNYRAQMQIGKKLEAVVVLIRAYSGQIYLQIFEYAKPNKKNHPTLICAEDLITHVSYLSDKVVAFIGGGMLWTWNKFFEKRNFLFLPRYVNAKMLGELALKVLSNGLLEDHHKEVLPLYIKAPSVGA